MHFKKKIVLSLVTIALLTSCATEDTYKADNLPAVNTDTGGETPNPVENNSSVTKVDISFTHEDGNVSWTYKNDETESTQGLATSTGNSIIYSKWDNRLQILDTSTKTITADKNYLDVTGSRYSSGENPRVDSTSGASEQILEKAFLNESGSSLYALLMKYADTSKTIGIGIYADDIGNGIPKTRFARRDSTANNYYAYPKIKDMALSHNGTKIVAVGDDRNIKIFDANNLNSPSEINTGKKLRSVNFSKNDEHIFVGSGGLSSYIFIYNVASKDKIAELETTETPKSILELPEQNKIIVIFNDSNKVRIYDISDITKLKPIKLLITNGKAKSIAISPDNKTFAITATGKNVNLFSIEDLKDPKVIKLTENCFGASFLSDKKLITAGESSIEFFDITIEKN
jgi:hypothetical protein